MGAGGPRNSWREGGIASKALCPVGPVVDQTALRGDNLRALLAPLSGSGLGR